MQNSADRRSLFRFYALAIAMAISTLLVGPRDAGAQQLPLQYFIDDVHHESLTRLVRENVGDEDEVFQADPGWNALVAKDLLTRLSVAELAGFPIGSSSGGFTYVFDSTTGLAVRSTPSFGPAFAERPLTIGRGKLNAGVTYLHRSFS